MNDLDFKMIVREVGRRLVDSYRSGGVPGGMNGPYDDQETPVRNLAHLAVITAVESVCYGEEAYRSRLGQMGEELLAMRQDNGLYVMRNKAGKDVCNGVIGHAWAGEGLLYVFTGTGEKRYLSAIDRICRQHRFNTRLGLWAKPSTDEIDYTLNHQLWYAANLAEVNEHLQMEEYDRELKAFLSMLTVNFSESANGRISHTIYRRESTVGQVKQTIKKLKNKFDATRKTPSLTYKEEGYHLFNLYALARLRRVFPDAVFFKSGACNAALGYVNRKAFLQGLDDQLFSLDASLKNENLTDDEISINVYGYPYNAPGFEIEYTDLSFGHPFDSAVIDKCKKKQLEYTYNERTNVFDKRCHDKNTINYRTYEYFRYLEALKRTTDESTEPHAD